LNLRLNLSSDILAKSDQSFSETLAQGRADYHSIGWTPPTGVSADTAEVVTLSAPPNIQIKQISPYLYVVITLLEIQLKKILLASACCAMFLAGSASAEMYIGAGVGKSKTDSSQSSWKLNGGFQFNPNWGLELGYADLGRDHTGGVKSWSLAGTGTMPLGSDWSLLGKLGVASNRSRLSSSADHSDMLVGVGIGYTINKNLGVRLEYEDYGKLPTDNLGNNSRGSNLGLSLRYTL
jgi:OOP family OmpA-OmpF porin